MITNLVPQNIELVPPGLQPRDGLSGSRMSIILSWYSEFMGGLGDALLRVYRHTGCYRDIAKIKVGEKGAAVLMCHNPSLSELFEFHPANLDGRLDVFDLGFNGPIYPWTDPIFRKENGLSVDSPCPTGLDPDRLYFYPHPKDAEPMRQIGALRPYVVLNYSAGTEERDIPEELVENMALGLRRRGFTPIMVGHPKYQRRPVNQNIVSFIGMLSLPGTILVERGAAGIVTAHTSILHIAWGEKRPVFLLYPTWVDDVWKITGRPEGYFFGVEQERTDHMHFSKYDLNKFEKWMERL
jgi:hypothetical protein